MMYIEEKKREVTPRMKAEHFDKMRAKAKTLAAAGLSQYEINAHLWNLTGAEADDRDLFDIAQTAVLSLNNGSNEKTDTF